VVVIWTSFERPGGLRKLLEEISNYPTETTRRRPPIVYPPSGTTSLALQLPFLTISESMGNHDSKIVDADSVD